MEHLHTPALQELDLEGKAGNFNNRSLADSTLVSLLPKDPTQVPILQSI